MNNRDYWEKREEEKLNKALELHRKLFNMLLANS